MQISDNLRGAAFMTGSMVAFTVNDTFLKGLSLDIPLAQTLFVRGVGTTLFLLMISYFMGQLRFDFSRKDWLLILIRAAAEIAAAYLFLTALFHMPIANVSAIMQVMPLSVALAAAVFFREPLGWRRVLAIAVGLLSGRVVRYSHCVGRVLIHSSLYKDLWRAATTSSRYMANC